MEIKVDSERLMRFLQATGPEIARAQTAVGHRIAQRYLGFHRARRMHGGSGVKGTRKGWLQAVKPEGGVRQKAFGYDLTGTGANMKLEMGIVSYIAHDLEVGALKRGKQDLLAVPFSGQTKAAIRKNRELIKAARSAAQASEFGFQLRRLRAKWTSWGTRIRKSGRAIRTPFIVKSKSGKEYWAIADPNAPGTWGARRVKILFHRHKTVQMKRRLEFFATWKHFVPTARQILATAIRFALDAARKKGGGESRRAA